ncbi:ATP-binding cassette domain-containing protein [Petroclostridium sp. X23]|jgi:peptide/nickel transport system ATP-binding protein|uniref:ABC transporter ATP-binding protein n=1 Tax=Petroclostridium sp. X23 TaxID=3045146 RepID=UPI0024AE2D18|nr:ATP-binding cassette domain-containing protein [Petroclostridium sp. X23]WHH59250.1 ATP-binding cassette domain-containing protein [Petroclostridium sp. X23]
MRLDAKNISFRYGNGSFILKDVNLFIDKGERVGLVGPSGYGKSTLAKILSGYLKPTKGEVLIDGKPLPAKGYCPVQLVYQHPEKALNPRWKLRDSLYEGLEPDVELLDSMGIEREWLDRWPNELSGGEMQRFCVARVLGEKTKFLIADEMSTMLDVITQAQIWNYVLQTVEKRGMGLLVVTHNHALADRICTRIIDLTGLNKI